MNLLSLAFEQYWIYNAGKTVWWRNRNSPASYLHYKIIISYHQLFSFLSICKIASQLWLIPIYGIKCHLQLKSKRAICWRLEIYLIALCVIIYQRERVKTFRTNWPTFTYVLSQKIFKLHNIQWSNIHSSM